MNFCLHADSISVRVTLKLLVIFSYMSFHNTLLTVVKFVKHKIRPFCLSCNFYSKLKILTANWALQLKHWLYYLLPDFEIIAKILVGQINEINVPIFIFIIIIYNNVKTLLYTPTQTKEHTVALHTWPWRDCTLLANTVL